jgi:hypothetical protein
MCANLLPLGNLLNRGTTRSSTVKEDASDGEDDEFVITEADVRNEDLGVSEVESIAAWNGVQKAVERYNKSVDESLSGDHRVLWSSVWRVQDVWR